jgi:cytochrome c553
MANRLRYSSSNKGLYLLFLIQFIFPNFIFAENDSPTKKSSINTFNYTSHDVRVGERIFHGLINTGAKTINCAACHNIGHIDTLNWNPSAMDLALKYANKDFELFKSAITQPTGNMMTAIHDSLQLNDEQIHHIKAYLNELAKNGGESTKPLQTNRIIFIILILIIILVIIDLTVFHKIKFKLVHVIILIAALYFVSNYLVTTAVALGRSQNYQPDQPIKFSHKVHAGQNKTNCLYCHFNAEQSKFAGIPPAIVCMNCHIIVREGSRSGKYEIDKIYKAIENNTAINWIKVHNLPDHVFFNHAQHVKVGKIDCMKCHGDVASMDQIIQVKDLSMGWCVNCHRETGVQFDNKFYGKYEKLHKDLKEGKIDKVTVAKIGGTDCMKCHY